MPGFLAEAQPWVISAVGIAVPSLTLLYAQRNRKQDTARTAGQQLIDNLFKEKDGLLKEKDGLRADITALKKEAAEAEASRQEVIEKMRALQSLHDHLLAEWVEIGTTRAEQLEIARFAYRRRAKRDAEAEEDGKTGTDTKG